MRGIKVIFIAMEILSLIAVILLAFYRTSEEGEFYKAMYISLFSILAVVMQKEQQGIEWEEE